MNDSFIRYATISDISLLVSISAQTFYETYQDTHLWSDLEYYVKNNLSELAIEADLNNKAICYLLLFLHDEAIGYVKLDKAGTYELPKQSKNPIEISRIYLIKSAQGKGYGKILMEASVNYAIQHKHDGIYLAVWEGNTKAILFYNKCGFLSYAETTFPMQSTTDRDLLLVKSL